MKELMEGDQLLESASCAEATDSPAEDVDGQRSGQSPEVYGITDCESVE